ncbi:MAG TPA: ADP-ribosylglycohydrolase family protein [Acidobacteriota bacterium]|nr:ADP-ribosylglycohydrolase family protein [Acidobacteriota bacterium]
MLEGIIGAMNAPVPIDTELEGRFHGVFYGCAVGDALGTPFEGKPISPGTDEETLLRGFIEMPGWPKGQYTDDTMLTLALARSIGEQGGVAGGHIIHEFATLWRKGIIIGAGSATNDAIGNYIYQHKPWDQCGAPIGDAGNGAAMRAAPIGLWYYDDLEAIIPAAIEASEVTHRDPRSIAAAVAVALMTAYAVQADSLDPTDILHLIAGLLLQVDTGISDHVMRLADWIVEPEDEAIRRIVATGQFGPWRGTWAGGITAYAVPTLLISFFCFLRHQDDFGKAVSRAILAGGDTDTSGAITGTLCGALRGSGAIPDHLREGVLNSKDIGAAAGRFYASRFGRTS